MSALLSGCISGPQDDHDGRSPTPNLRWGSQVEVTTVAGLSYQINGAGVEAG